VSTRVAGCDRSLSRVSKGARANNCHGPRLALIRHWLNSSSTDDGWLPVYHSKCFLCTRASNSFSRFWRYINLCVCVCMYAHCTQYRGLDAALCACRSGAAETCINRPDRLSLMCFDQIQKLRAQNWHKRVTFAVHIFKFAAIIKLQQKCNTEKMN